MASAIPESLVVRDGVCHALYSYDVGLSIDLAACDRRIPSLKQQERVKDKRRAPESYFEQESPPLRMTLKTSAIPIHGISTPITIDLVIHDFGAVTVIFGFPIEGPLSKILELSHLLYDNEALRSASLQQLERLVEDILEKEKKIMALLAQISADLRGAQA